MSVNPSPQTVVSHSPQDTPWRDPLFACCCRGALASGTARLRQRAERALEAHTR